ncbi:MAG: prolipoprotein diacylglyceryl transferase [Syntrophobacteria bacterium]
MVLFPRIDPNIIEIGPFKLRWYGLMYVLAFLATYFLIPRQRRARELGLQGAQLQDLIFYLAIGLVVCARLGYILFYQFSDYTYYLQHPLEIIGIWHGGMSFHGGAIGVLAAGALFCRRRHLPFWKTADAVVVTVPVGLFLGRLANFINSELFGRPSSLPWAMVFPTGGPVPRHPSQLYEAALEGVVLFGILWSLRNRPFRPGTMVCLFLGGYGIFRFIVEFFRQPDPQVGLLWGLLSMGQLLCMVMIIAAVVLRMVLSRKPPGEH